MSPAERNHSLTNRTPEARARILAKVREYQVLGPDERELRLRATELRWYLTPLLRGHAEELSRVLPDAERLTPAPATMKRKRTTELLRDSGFGIWDWLGFGVCDPSGFASSSSPSESRIPNPDESRIPNPKSRRSV